MKRRFLLLSLLSFLLNPLFGQDGSVNFSEAYIKANDGQVKIKIEEVQEMLHVIMAVSDAGLKDSNMINHNGAYYKEVIDRFGRFRDHRAVKIADSLLNESIIYYIFLSSNANGFVFDDKELVRTNIYTFPARGVGSTEISEDPIVTYKKELEDFAVSSDFRTFYAQHKPFYDTIKQDYEKYGGIDKQKAWLERKFDYKINSYRVLTSPLIGGIHATQTFENNNFKEMLLYLLLIKRNKELSEELNIAMSTRVIFTEIDHNYVGPLSDQYKSTIDTIFDNRSFWVNAANKATAHYPSPIKVYDEYMTWGLFLLYASDTYSDKNSLSYIEDHLNIKMVAKGFPKSEIFNKELYRLYGKNRKGKIDGIYREMLKWSGEQR